MSRSVTVVGPSGKTCGCQVDASSASYHRVILSKLSLSFLLCGMDLLKYLSIYLEVGGKVDKEK